MASTRQGRRGSSSLTSWLRWPRWNATGSVEKIGGSQREAVALRRSGGRCQMVVEPAHGLSQSRGPNATRSFTTEHLAPKYRTQATGARTSITHGAPAVELHHGGHSQG